MNWGGQFWGAVGLAPASLTPPLPPLFKHGTFSDKKKGLKIRGGEVPIRKIFLFRVSQRLPGKSAVFPKGNFACFPNLLEGAVRTRGSGPMAYKQLSPCLYIQRGRGQRSQIFWLLVVLRQRSRYLPRGGGSAIFEIFEPEPFHCGSVITMQR
jgi:hypothetical protein